MDIRKNRSQLRRWYKELNWSIHRALAKEFFDKVALQARQDDFLDYLYVSINANNSQIQIASGSHPAGPQEVIFDQNGKQISKRIPTEQGATLVISQGGDGSVTVSLYPFHSEKMERKVPHIIWAVFADPAELTESVLQDVTRDFFTYMKVSSVHFTESRCERLRIQFLELKGLRYAEGGGILPFVVKNWAKEVIVIAGAVAGVLALLK
ncbi:hypothetical protein [Pectobacterium brasiliense]|uniref:hypothetical protein n=1 Tax=Pectobacterium brasiliense TaxID=180957 RepID=UPI001969191F|nr:hypothetical protein [Pectobacterium brasiliense]MBN3263031.1 hypothetical protein [Pectobacterium brasiliense]